MHIILVSFVKKSQKNWQWLHLLVYVCLQFCRWTSAFYSFQNANIKIINHKAIQGLKTWGRHPFRQVHLYICCCYHFTLDKRRRKYKQLCLHSCSRFCLHPGYYGIAWCAEADGPGLLTACIADDPFILFSGKPSVTANVYSFTQGRVSLLKIASCCSRRRQSPVFCRKAAVAHGETTLLHSYSGKSSWVSVGKSHFHANKRGIIYKNVSGMKLHTARKRYTNRKKHLANFRKMFTSSIQMFLEVSKGGVQWMKWKAETYATFSWMLS